MDRGVGATPRRLLIVAVAVVLGGLVSAVGAGASAGGAVRATPAAIAGPYPCHQVGVTGPKQFGHLRSGVRCGVPEDTNVPCLPKTVDQVCLAKLTVTVRAKDGHKHDLEAEGELGGRRSHHDCAREESCTLKEPLLVRFPCSSLITGEAIGFQNATYEGLFGLERREAPAKIRVQGELTVEGLVPASEARLAHAAAGGCGATAPLEVLVGGASTDDPLTETPIASGYGNVSVSPPGAIVDCPYVTDYRSCFGTWNLPLGEPVTLTATPDSTNASYFAGWRSTGSLNCPSTSLTCTVTAGQVSQVTALFGAPIFKLTIDNANANEGGVVPSGFSNLGPTPDHIQCGAGLNDCTAYYPLVDAATMPNFNGPEPLSLAQDGIITYAGQQWYIKFDSGCDQVNVVVDGSNRYTVCYYHMTSDRTISVSWTTTPP